MITTENIISLKVIQESLQQGVYTCVDLVQHYLGKIEASKFTNAYVHVFENEALQKAQELDHRIKNGKTGKLFGLIISVKDLICIEGKEVSAGSKILKGYVSPFHSTCIDRMVREDVIIIGTTNCDEFGMGSASENSCYGAVKHFTHPEHVPGGSSGGSAVSLQAGTCLVSLGTDTGGSVRQPAAFCGLYGLKPTYGKVSRHGLVAYASSFDQLGIFGINIDDISRVLEVVEGVDEKDSTTVDRGQSAPDSYRDQSAVGGQQSAVNSRESSVSSRQSAVDSQQSVVDGQRAAVVSQQSAVDGLMEREPLKVAVLEDAVNSDGLQKEIKIGVQKAIRDLEENGNLIEQVSFPLLKYAVPAYYILTTAEASSNLSRYDGVRYGYRSEKGKDLEEMYRHTRSEGFGAEVKRRIMMGTFVLSSGYFDAYFTRAQKVRNLITQQMESILSEHDVIVLPTTPKTAWKSGSKDEDPVSVYLADIYTVVANLCGLPSITIPIGKDEAGLPFGIQVIGRRFEDERLLQFAAQFHTVVI